MLLTYNQEIERLLHGDIVIPFVPITSWLKLALSSNFAKQLFVKEVVTTKYVVTIAGYNNGFKLFVHFVFLLYDSYSSIVTGKWFQEFVIRCGASIPVALDVYFDGWKVSNEKKLNGLYFTVANVDKSLNWKVAYKFPVCLLPPYVDLQVVLPQILECVGWKNPPSMYNLSKFDNEEKSVKVEIARVIGDTPGVAEFTGVKNHRAGI